MALFLNAIFVTTRTCKASQGLTQVYNRNINRTVLREIVFTNTFQYIKSYIKLTVLNNKEFPWKTLPVHPIRKPLRIHQEYLKLFKNKVHRNYFQWKQYYQYCFIFSKVENGLGILWEGPSTFENPPVNSEFHK